MAQNMWNKNAFCGGEATRGFPASVDCMQGVVCKTTMYAYAWIGHMSTERKSKDMVRSGAAIKST